MCACMCIILKLLMWNHCASKYHFKSNLPAHNQMCVTLSEAVSLMMHL